LKLSKYFIIGCGLRSGVTYTYELLQAAGLDIGYGEPGKDGVIGWQYLMNTHPAVMKAMRKARNSGRKPLVWLMQVRNPVDTINCMADMYARGDWPPIPSIRPVESAMRLRKDDSPILKAMKLYYHINICGMRSRKFTLRYRIEDMPRVWPSIAEIMEKPGLELPDVPLFTNPDKGMTWEEMCETSPGYGLSIKRMAHEMGYVSRQ